MKICIQIVISVQYILGQTHFKEDITSVGIQTLIDTGKSFILLDVSKIKILLANDKSEASYELRHAQSHLFVEKMHSSKTQRKFVC